jgi:hypothetical protein
MLKIKIKKIKFDRRLVWKIGVVAFLVLLVVIFVLNVFVFAKTKDRIVGDVVKTDFSPKVIKKELFEDVVSRLEEKESVFEKTIKKKPYIKDPSI